MGTIKQNLKLAFFDTQKNHFDFLKHVLTRYSDDARLPECRCEGLPAVDPAIKQ